VEGVRLSTPDGISVHCFPSVDGDFRTETQRIVAQSWGQIHAAERLIADVQQRLRERYPQAVVRVRDEQAELGRPAILTLYAFRDGRAA
jgi:hypothetical protein